MYSYPNRFCEGTVIHFPNAEIINNTKNTNIKNENLFLWAVGCLSVKSCGPGAVCCPFKFFPQFGQKQALDGMRDPQYLQNRGFSNGSPHCTQKSASGTFSYVHFLHFI